MDKAFTAVVDSSRASYTIKMAFGAPAQNDRIVPDAVEAVRALCKEGGPSLCLTGPVTVAAAMAIGHTVAHLFGWVAMYDPKLPGDRKFVVVVSHSPEFKVGDCVE